MYDPGTSTHDFLVFISDQSEIIGFKMTPPPIVTFRLLKTLGKQKWNLIISAQDSSGYITLVKLK